MYRRGKLNIIKSKVMRMNPIIIHTFYNSDASLEDICREGEKLMMLLLSNQISTQCEDINIKHTPTSHSVWSKKKLTQYHNPSCGPST